NDFVRGTFAGRLGLPQARNWYHLFNQNDRVFTASIDNQADNFLQVETDFLDPPLNHDGTHYLSNESARTQVFAGLGAPATRRLLATGMKAFTRTSAAPRRALLVGVNDYPDPANRLEGCVNDVFLMSAVLQESGFA